MSREVAEPVSLFEYARTTVTIAIAAGALVTSGCVEVDDGTAATSTLPEAAVSVEHPDGSTSVMADTPELNGGRADRYDSCSDLRKPLESDPSINPEEVFDRVFHNQFGMDSVRETLDDARVFFDLYDVDLRFASKLDQTDFRVVTFIEPDEELPLLGFDLEKIAGALLNFDPAAIKAAAPNLVLVKGIETSSMTASSSGLTLQANGLYVPVDNTIYLDIVGPIAPHEHFGHELEHALAYSLICAEGGATTDEAFSAIGAYKYVGRSAEYDNIDKSLITPGPDREFASAYGSVAVEEDRAETLQITLFDRGLILPGDPDFGSPFHEKQQLLIERIDRLTPGFAEDLLDRTHMLRNRRSMELNVTLPNPYEPGETGVVSDILESAFHQGKPVEQLRGAILTIWNPEDDSYTAIENPLVVRNQEGQIFAVAWASTTQGLQGGYFVQDLMELRSEDAQGVNSVKDTISYSARNGINLIFDPAIIMIDGVPSQQLASDDGFNLSQDTIEQRWPHFVAGAGLP